MKILLIEDDLSTLNFIKKGLKESGHIVDAFSNCNDGLDAAYLGEHDVIILDRMLPEIDGLTIVTKIRNNKITTPVLFLSALGVALIQNQKPLLIVVVSHLPCLLVQCH